MKDNENKVKFKTSLRFSNIVMVCIVAIFCILLAINMIRLRNYNKKSLELSQAHIKYTDVAMQVNLGSDILTEKVRLFAETGDVSYLYEYFEETKETGHRNVAIQELDNLPWGHNDDNVRRAMRESERLMEREYYAMRLAALGYKIPESSLPEEIKSVELLPRDINISLDEAKEKARTMLFDDTYMGAKQRIKAHINIFLDNVMDISLYEYNDITKKLERNIFWQSVIILSMLIVILIITVFINKFIIRPLIRASKNIKNNKPIDMPASLEEMTALKNSYNSLWAHNNELMRQLNLIARKDALTGMGSRFEYNSYIDTIKDKSIPLLMFVFDVNNLRSTNNNEGHAMGDKLLIDAAGCIKKVFGIYDYETCFRVGGDEFVAFIEKEPRKRANVYIEQFNKETEKTGVSVSVGYTYAENISEASINAMFNDADVNMYKAKYREN